MICSRGVTIYRFGNDEILPKTCSWNSKFTKTKNHARNYDRYATLKNHLWFTLGGMTVMRISK